MAKQNKFFIVVGARPNFIKIAPLFDEFKKYKEIKPILVHTGQHYDFEMSQIFFQELKIPKPNYNLEVKAGLHSKQTGKTMIELEKVCLKERPNLVIVVGDVNASLAGALVAVKLHIPVAHIEAGLRSYDMSMPEEVNRHLTDHVSDILFCPTDTAVQNLKKEGITKGVYNVGDLMYDIFLKSRVKTQKSKILQKLNLKPKDYILLTVHRASNTDNLENLKNILQAIIDSGEKVVFPVHPRTKKQLQKLKIRNLKLKIISPVGYLDMLILEKNAKKILTDSGGVQKEAYFVQVPCITLRDRTEWVETVKSGWNVLVDANQTNILRAIQFFCPRKAQKKYFGQGLVTQKIVKILNLKYR